MKVLLLTMGNPGQIGGISTHVAMLARGLEELGHEARVYCPAATMPEFVRNARLTWPAGALNRVRRGWGMMYSAEARARLLCSAASQALAGTADSSAAINAQEVYSVPLLRKVADEYGVPLVLTLHGYPLYESVSEGYSDASKMGLRYLERAEMRALRLADAIVTVDRRLYQHALKLVPERADSVYTLANFIDTSAFAPHDDAAEEERLRSDSRRAWNIPEGRLVLFCPRRLVKKNGVIYPSLALATMGEADRSRFLVLHAGDGGERAEIERIIRGNRLEENVRLLGGQGREAMRDLYRAADIVLVPSVHSANVEEATSLAALEAMASGRPLIAGDVGGLAQMLVDGETGLLVPESAQSLAAAILRLASDPELGARLAAAARNYVAANHSHLKAAASYAEVYRRTAVSLAGPRASASAVERISANELVGPLVGAQPERAVTPPWSSITVLGFPLDVVSLEQAAQWTISTATGAATVVGRTAVAVSYNPELVMRAQRDPAAEEALRAADLCYPDGAGAVWAARRQGARLPATGSAPERVTGIDLAQRVLELAAERALPVYFLGAAEGVAEIAAQRQVARCPGLQVVGAHHGYFSAAEEGEVVRRVRDSGAGILLAAMGAPRQEIFLHRHRHELGAAVALGVGGTFDVWAGVVKRAPSWAQRANVEWLHRLVTHPQRLSRQRVLPRFAVQVVRGSAYDYGPPRRGAWRGSRGGAA
jgi:exopolysaccharide biosynthesis WecB/TagA/CpsF family protein